MLIHQHIKCRKEIARYTFTIVCNCFYENLWAFFAVASRFTTREINTMLKLSSINISLKMNINWWVNGQKRVLWIFFSIYLHCFLSLVIRLFILTYRWMPIGTPNDSPIDHFTVPLNETQHWFFYLRLVPITSYHLNLNRKSSRPRLRFLWGIPKNKACSTQAHEAVSPKRRGFWSKLHETSSILFSNARERVYFALSSYIINYFHTYIKHIFIFQC